MVARGIGVDSVIPHTLLVNFLVALARFRHSYTRFFIFKLFFCMFKLDEFSDFLKLPVTKPHSSFLSNSCQKCILYFFSTTRNFINYFRWWRKSRRRRGRGVWEFGYENTCRIDTLGQMAWNLERVTNRMWLI